MGICVVVVLALNKTKPSPLFTHHQTIIIIFSFSIYETHLAFMSYHNSPCLSHDTLTLNT